MKLVHSPEYRTCRLWVPAKLSKRPDLLARVAPIIELVGGCTEYTAYGVDKNGMEEEVRIIEFCAFECGQKQLELRDLVTALAQDLIYEFGEDSAMYDAGGGPNLITQED